MADNQVLSNKIPPTQSLELPKQSFLPPTFLQRQTNDQVRSKQFIDSMLHKGNPQLLSNQLQAQQGPLQAQFQVPATQFRADSLLQQQPSFSDQQYSSVQQLQIPDQQRLARSQIISQQHQQYRKQLQQSQNPYQSSFQLPNQPQQSQFAQNQANFYQGQFQAPAQQQTQQSHEPANIVGLRNQFQQKMEQKQLTNKEILAQYRQEQAQELQKKQPPQDDFNYDDIEELKRQISENKQKAQQAVMETAKVQILPNGAAISAVEQSSLNELSMSRPAVDLTTQQPLLLTELKRIDGKNQEKEQKRQINSVESNKNDQLNGQEVSPLTDHKSMHDDDIDHVQQELQRSLSAFNNLLKSQKTYVDQQLDHSLQHMQQMKSSNLQKYSSDVQQQKQRELDLELNKLQTSNQHVNLLTVSTVNKDNQPVDISIVQKQSQVNVQDLTENQFLVQQLSNKVLELQDENTVLNSRVTTQIKSQDYLKEIIQLKKENEQLRLNLNEANIIISDCKTQAQNIDNKDQIELLQSENNNLKYINQQLTAHLESFRVQTEEAKLIKQNLTERNEKLTQQVSEQQKYILQLNDKIAALQDNHQDKLSQSILNQSLQTAADDRFILLQKECQYQQQLVQELSEKNERNQRQFDQAKEALTLQIEKLEKQNTEYYAQSRDLEAQNNIQLQQIKDLKNSNTQLEKQYKLASKYQDQVSQQETQESSKLESEIKDLKQKLLIQVSLNSDLQHQLIGQKPVKNDLRYETESPKVLQQENEIEKLQQEIRHLRKIQSEGGVVFERQRSELEQVKRDIEGAPRVTFQAEETEEKIAQKLLFCERQIAELKGSNQQLLVQKRELVQEIQLLKQSGKLVQNPIVNETKQGFDKVVADQSAATPLQDNIQELRLTIEKLQLQVQLQSTQMQDNKLLILQKEQELERLQQQNEENGIQIDDLQVRVEDLQAENQKLQTQQMDEIILDQRNQLNRLTKKLNDQHDRLSQQVSDLQSKLNIKSQQLMKLQNEFDNKLDVFRTTTEQIQELAMQDQLLNCSQLQQIQSTKDDRLQEQKFYYQNMVQDLREQIQKLKVQLQDNGSTPNFDTIQDQQLQQLQDTIDTQAKVIKSLQKAKNSYKELDNKIFDLQNELIVKDNTIQDLEEKVEKLEGNKVIQLQQQVDYYSNQLESIRQENKEFKNNNQKLTKQVESLQQSHQNSLTLKEQVSLLEQTIEDVQEQCDQRIEQKNLQIQKLQQLLSQRPSKQQVSCQTKQNMIQVIKLLVEELKQLKSELEIVRREVLDKQELDIDELNQLKKSTRFKDQDVYEQLETQIMRNQLLQISLQELQSKSLISMNQTRTREDRDFGIEEVFAEFKQQISELQVEIENRNAQIIQLKLYLVNEQFEAEKCRKTAANLKQINEQNQSKLNLQKQLKDIEQLQITDFSKRVKQLEEQFGREQDLNQKLKEQYQLTYSLLVHYKSQNLEQVTAEQRQVIQELLQVVQEYKQRESLYQSGI